MHRNRSVDVHKFSMVPRADIPRSRFDRQFTHKTTFDAGYLVPILVDEVLPGDTFNLSMTAFARLATPIFPLMDNLWLDSFFFFVPNRLVWSNWVKFMGEQLNPADSISFSVPQLVSSVGGYAANSVFDYFGLPTAGQVIGGNTVSHSALPLRSYNLIYNTWFRDENLQNSFSVQVDDGPDSIGAYALARRGKRADYFTSCLPWPQKGGTSVTLPLGTSAPVNFSSQTIVGSAAPTFNFSSTSGPHGIRVAAIGTNQTLQNSGTTTGSQTDPATWGAPGLTLGGTAFADLSAATAATINQLRQSFQIQKLLERDARGGTRYTEIVRSHFGVISPDARLQRPEYLGGGSTPVSINPIAQTSATGLTGGSAPLGNLAAMGSVLARNHGFTQSFTEHGHIIGLVSVRADLTYQQGLRKLWSRSTRYDFYFPVFAMLGEQAVLNKEIYVDGSANDVAVFGYQERWAEYRYLPSMISGQFRSTYATPLDAWHLAQKFTTLPTLNATFIQDTPPVSRIVSIGAGANGQQFIFDSFFSCRTVRAMPMYSVPGLIDHF
ncbi:MAG: major capsid protein [Microviridae sp.]|nr:MAG: major capsid protein [Microviridae sp.]